LKTEDPNTYNYILGTKYKVFILDDKEWDEVVEGIVNKGFSISKKSDQRSYRDWGGLHMRKEKEIYLKVKLDKERGKYRISPSERAQFKESVVHEFSHARNYENLWANMKREWKNTEMPMLKEELGLFKKRLLGRISKEDYAKEREKQKKKRAFSLARVNPEYPAYHNEWRFRRRLHRSYLDKVRSAERRGDFKLDNYRKQENKLSLYNIGDNPEDIAETTEYYTLKRVTG
jgi:hypothetical protein